MRTTALGVLLVACSSDPTLHVTVHHPASATVARTEITVYESETLTCEDVEFAQLTADQLAAIAVATETIDAAGNVTGNLDGLSRTGNKVIVARGYTTSGQLVTAGCTSKGEVTGADDVAVTTVLAATVSIRPPVDQADLSVMVNVVDPSGIAIEGRPVSWTVYGPAGSAPASMANVTADPGADGVWRPTLPTCTSGGTARVHPVPAGVVGGYAVQMRVAWSVELPPLYTSLTNADFGLASLTPPAGSTKFCAIRISGSTHRVVCLDGGLARDYAVTVANGKASLTAMQTHTFVEPDPIAVVSVPSGTDRDVYAITGHGRVVELFGAPAGNNSTPVCAPGACTTPVDDVLVVPACGTQPGKLLLHLANTTPDQIVQMDARGGNAMPFPVGTDVLAPVAVLDSAGCVTELTPTGSSDVRQLAAIHLGRRSLVGDFIPLVTNLYTCQGSSCTARTNDQLVRGAGVGFTGGTEPRLIVASVDATGVVMVQSVLTANGAVERARAPAASIPGRVVAGQFDTDSTTDMLWDVSSRQGSSFELAYARKIGDTPLEGLSPPQVNVIVADLQTGDLTGDGIDDIVAIGAQTTTTGTTTGVAVVPLHVPVTATTPADPTCAP